MRLYNNSDIFIKMNSGNAIYNQLTTAVRSTNDTCVLNGKISSSLDNLQRAYRETLTLKAIDAVKSFEIILVAMPIDKRFPANIPYIRTKRNGKDCVIIDFSKYCTIKRNESGGIIEASCDIPKLYNILIPAYIALNVLNGQHVISTETTKWMSYLWAVMFNKVLKSQKVFVGNPERYEAFMYFAMRFFMIYYLETPMAIVEKVSGEFIKNVKSKYILMIESNLNQKQINLYQDWSTFAYTMFSNEITNIRAITNVDMSTEQYLRTFSGNMGRDGAYLALWSADYFLYCLFVTSNKAYILNDRAWDDIFNENKNAMPRILSGLYKEI
jgi:hypothetical protein